MRIASILICEIWEMGCIGRLTLHSPDHPIETTPFAARSYYGRTSGLYALIVEDTPLLNLAQGKPAIASSTGAIGN
jgi:hypothetical protein